MKREYLELGQTPANEPASQVGEPNYRVNAQRECRAFIQAIRNYLGPEPDGAELAVKSFPHDFGHYLEVVCYYDPQDDAAVNYAFRCEAKAPLTWADGSVRPPVREEGRRRER